MRRFTLVALVVVVTACRRSTPSPVPAQTAAAPASSTAASVPHGDHNPRHGGVVLMKGDLHYEVVLDPTGRSHRVYFTDAVREELPASVASDVVVTIQRPSLPAEPIPMQIDDTGESWIGSGQPVAAPANTTARVAFSIGHEPYWIDIPFATTR